jgi:hypothetical protein
MGHGLQRLTQACCGKLPIVIHEWTMRHVVPIVAAKYATECNIAVRNYIPMLKHWSKYKDQLALFDLFLARIHVSTLSFNFPHLVLVKTIVFYSVFMQNT